MKPDLLFKVEAKAYRAPLAALCATHDYDPAGATPDAAVRARARIMVTSGTAGLTRDDLAALPSLGLACCIGTGYENIDIAACRERGVRVTHAAGTNAPAVADHAFALLLAAMRAIPAQDAAVRAGLWHAVGPRPMLAGKRLGLLGLGAIGLGIARRAAGFELEVGYCTRRPRPEHPWRFVPDLRELAAWADALVVAAPGGPETFHLVDRAVLRALGPRGFLVNVGRGTVVDGPALAEALAAGEIAGAALDVFETEPDIPEALRAAPNLVLTPHVGGLAPEVQARNAALMIRNIEAFLAGTPLASPIPEMRDLG